MLLTIDIGNTTVAVGGFLGPELRFVRRLPSDRNMDAAACAARLRYSTTWPCVGNRTTSYAGAPIGPVASADASMSSLFSLMPSL